MKWVVKSPYISSKITVHEMWTLVRLGQ